MQTETLYSTVGGADKQYTITVEAVTGGYKVLCFNGRRGGTQVPQLKTLKPVTQEAAGKMAAKIRATKIASGYQPGQAAAPMAPMTSVPAVSLPPTGRMALPPSNPYRPMLLNPITVSEAEALLCNPEWFVQQKVDGVRAIVQVNVWEKNVTAQSRTGKPVALTAEVVAALLASFATDVILDSESLGTVLVIFDILSHDVTDLRGDSAEDRLVRLDSMAKLANAPACLVFIQTARTKIEKNAAVKILQAGGAEGVVFKHRRGKYVAGRPNTGGYGLKWKFVASASLRVTCANIQRSVNMATSEGVEVGSVTIPPNHKVPPVGSTIEVEYLYANRGGSLSQAVYKGIREDHGPDALDSLQYKGEER